LSRSAEFNAFFSKCQSVRFENFSTFNIQKDPLLCWAKPNCCITQDDLFGLYFPALSFFMPSTIAIICFYRFLNFCGLAASNVALKAASVILRIF
jgi:hypothetical protein